jgi:Tfp pilus assembly protein PilW
MANRPISISGINPDGSLILSDNGSTNVNPADTVTWQLSPNSGVASINGIIDSSTTDVFSPDPARLANSSNWQGTVNPLIARGSEERYTINYTRANGSETGSFDPKIQVNP